MAVTLVKNLLKTDRCNHARLWFNDVDNGQEAKQGVLDEHLLAE